MLPVTLAAVILLGVFHGINPAMGWLFAVARGLQERSRDLLLQSLPVIALGHLGSVALVVVVVTLTGSLVTGTTLSIVCGLVLVGFGLWRLLAKRHFRWVGMRLSLPQLAAWSFLMSSVHGAGLMLLPVLTGMPAAGHHGHAMSGGLLVAGIHTLAMFVTATVIAVIVYEIVGVAILRKAWFNLDRMWAFALIGAGVFSLVGAV
ncbi:MAG: hypothetical protein IRY84_13795 [Thermobispora bispora]|nr:hypothetical protein [Thermobispora bispora]MBO2473080.1 hypothetical protein [Actinomycetales bacterium]MBX6168694.1 hypothetical protein [Thermobispora bispora]MDI9579693.1 hypothetical protein [Thermobispora sp.]QSI47648.1 hypothetical protein CYL17_07035 [Thermobispora bispora]